MVSSIHIENFKSYHSADLKVNRLTVLIGANASGKSNALEAIRLLSWMAKGHKFSELQEEVDSGDRLIRGKVKDLSTKARDPQVGLGVSLEWEKSIHWNVKLGISSSAQLYLIRESAQLEGEEGPIYDMNGLLRGLEPGDTPRYSQVKILSEPQIPYGRPDRYLQNPDILLDGLAFPQLHRLVSQFQRQYSDSTPLLPVFEQLQRNLVNILFLDPQPSACRGYVSLSRKDRLRENAGNLSAVLFGLWNHETKADLNQKLLLDFIQSLPEQQVSSLSFLETPREEVMVELVETFGGNETRVEAALLSDGTLRVLAVAAAMISAPEGSLIILEEIGNGVHPGRVKHLLRQIDRIAQERSLQILISTHNPALLDAIPDHAIGDIVFCYRDPNEGDSRLVRLQDLPDFPALVAQDSMGDMVSDGLLDRFVKHHPGEDAKKKQALNWLNSMR